MFNTYSTAICNADYGFSIVIMLTNFLTLNFLIQFSDSKKSSINLSCPWYAAAWTAFLPLYEGANGENYYFTNGFTNSKSPKILAQNK